LNKVEPHR